MKTIAIKVYRIFLAGLVASQYFISLPQAFAEGEQISITPGRIEAYRPVIAVPVEGKQDSSSPGSSTTPEANQNNASGNVQSQPETQAPANQKPAPGPSSGMIFLATEDVLQPPTPTPSMSPSPLPSEEELAEGDEIKVGDIIGGRPVILKGGRLVVQVSCRIGPLNGRNMPIPFFPHPYGPAITSKGDGRMFLWVSPFGYVDAYKWKAWVDAKKLQAVEAVTQAQQKIS